VHPNREEEEVEVVGGVGPEGVVTEEVEEDLEAEEVVTAAEEVVTAGLKDRFLVVDEVGLRISEVNFRLFISKIALVILIPSYM
jgi:hypothetical protein